MEFFGREVKKEFKGQGTYTGKVIDYHRTHGYRVQYDDGDAEDLTKAELVRQAARLLHVRRPSVWLGWNSAALLVLPL